MPFTPEEIRNVAEPLLNRPQFSLTENRDAVARMADLYNVGPAAVAGATGSDFDEVANLFNNFKTTGSTAGNQGFIGGPSSNASGGGGTSFDIGTPAPSSSRSGNVSQSGSTSSSFSGIPGLGQDTVTDWITQLDSMLNIGNFDDRIGNIFDTAGGRVNTAFDDANKLLSSTLNTRLAPQLQAGVNQLSGRGVLNSSVAGDLLSRIGRGVAGDVLQEQAQLGGQRANILSQLGVGEAASKSALPKLIADIVGNLGRTTTSDSLALNESLGASESQGSNLDFIFRMLDQAREFGTGA